jgi:tape measure domain protein|nr:MAG TPA: tail tape measure protein [Caudoviricetes sp.]
MLSALQGVQNGVRQTQRVVEQSGQGIEQVFSKVQSAAAAAAGAFSAKELVRNVLEVRGQFQQLEVAFTTMLGSADKANDLMSQLVRTAATTPFDLKSVSEGAKQLLAYGTQADEVNGTLIRLGDIAAGLSIPLNDLVYLYGTTMTQGRMFTQDLRQFQGRGIPIADELAKIFGVTKDKVGELVTAGKVGAAEVQQAIENMTNAGSRFGGLMEAQSHTITGQISNIEDAIDSMFNDIGKANEGVINDALGGVSYLVEHWKEIGQIVLNVAAAYGVAKAAVVAWSTYQKIHNLLMEKAAVQMALAKAEGIAMSEAEAMASVATMGFKNALNALKVAIASNPVGALAVALTAVFTAMQLLDDETTELATASNKYGESAARSIQKVKTLSDEVKGLSNSNKTVTTSTKLSKDVLEELNQVLEESGVARIKEGDTIDTVNKKREMAISLIKEEAIERQRLNNIDAGNKEFDDKVNSANEQLRKDLANATFYSTGDTVLNKLLGSADEVREKSSAIFTVISQTVQENADLIANKTGSAYDKGLNEIYGKIRAKMEAMGVSKAALDKTWTDGGWLKQDNLVQKYIDSIQGATEAHYDYNKSVNAVAEAEKRAADKTLSFSDKVAGISRALQGPNDGVHQLYKNIQKLMDKYKKNTIGFEIQFSGKVPAWMDKMDIPELARLSKYFTSLGESLKEGQVASVNGKKYTKQGSLQHGANFASALKAKLDKANAAKNNENKGKSNPIAEQKKALQEKLNALSYQEAAGRKGAELRRKINALAKKEKVYSSSYDTDNAKEAQRKAKEAADKAKREREERNAENEREFEYEVKSRIEKARTIEDLANETEQAEIDLMKDGTEKRLRQIELDRKREQQAVDRAFEDLKQKRIDQAKQAWSINKKNKGLNFYESSEYKNASSDKRYTEDEYKNYDAKTSAIWKKYDDALEKEKQEQIAHEDSLIKANESYYDKKASLAKEYSKTVADINKAISEAEKRNDKDRVEALYRSLTEAKANFGKDQMSLAFEQLKKDPNYVVAFDDLNGASTSTLNSLIDRFDEVKQAAGEALNPEGVKTYFDAINGMIDELISRDPIGMIKKLTDELIKQQDELKASENRRDRVKGGEKIVKNIGYNKDLKKWVAEYWELADAEADVATKGQQVAQTTHKIENAHKTLTKSIQGVADKMGELGGKIGGQTGEIFSLFGSVMTYYQTISDGVTAIGKAGSNAMKAIESASVILAIISAAIQLMQTLSSVLPNQDDLYEKAAQKQAEINKLRDSVNDYRLAVMKARHEEGNWFSDSGLKGLQDAYEEHGQVAESYYKKLNEAQERYIDKSSGLRKAMVPIVAGITAIAAVAAGVFTAGTGTAAIGALGSAVIGALTTTAVTATVATAAGVAVAGLAGAIVGKAIDSAVSSITYKNGQVAAKDNLRIQTQHKSFWRGQKTADLKEWVKEKYGKDLFGEDGMIDKELANEVLKNYGHKLQGEAKETLEKLVELREKYDEFNKSIHEYVSKMYSPLVSDMTDAVWAWLKDGKDALSEFKNSASKTFADISKDMVKQLLLKNVFSKYEDKLSNLYKAYAMKAINENELGAASANLAGEIVDSMNSYLPVAQSLLKQLQEGFAAKGIDITREGDSSQTATANGVTSITFEQASNIIALTTAGNISRDQTKELVTSIVSNLASLSSFSSSTSATIVEIRNLMITNNSYLEDILKNSKNIYNDFSSKIDDINRNLKELK